MCLRFMPPEFFFSLQTRILSVLEMLAEFLHFFSNSAS
jgi:hypothetical protein